MVTYDQDSISDKLKLAGGVAVLGLCGVCTDAHGGSLRGLCADAHEELRTVDKLVILIFMAIKLRLENEKGPLSFALCSIKLSVLATDKHMHVGATW